MSVRQSSKKSAFQENSWAVCAGDFSALKHFLAEKEKPVWVLFQLLDALLRGFGQVVFANNPISGLLIVAAFAATAPGTLIFSSATALLGLLLSVVTRDSQENIENGLTVNNPLLVGAISYAWVPLSYGPFDSFSILLILLGTIISVYLTRSLGNCKSPCSVWPFNLVEFALLVILSVQENEPETRRILHPIMEMDNATSDATTDDASFIGENAADVYIDWGMVFHGIIASASQTYGVRSIPAGSVIYLGILIFSPTTACFCFVGALMGSLIGLELGVPVQEVYDGLWGYNSFLTAGSLGGNYIVLNCQTTAATMAAIVYTTMIQYASAIVLNTVKTPVLTLPYLFVTALFVKLRDDRENRTFVRPLIVSSPEKQRQDYLSNRRAFIQQVNEEEDVEVKICKDKGDSLVVDI